MDESVSSLTTKQKTNPVNKHLSYFGKLNWLSNKIQNLREPQGTIMI
jgi:hypothetical protein